MHRLLKKDQLFTIPNLLSVIRLLLIPLIIWLYCEKQDYPAAVATIILSGLTDIVDGFIARRFHMVSDFGKILDPIADKLTQGAVIICLTTKYKWMILLIVVFALKEFSMLLMGYMAIRKQDSVNSSQWHGKANTVLLYVTMVLLILFPKIPLVFANAMIIACILMMLFSLVRYASFYKKLFSQKKKEE